MNIVKTMINTGPVTTAIFTALSILGLAVTIDQYETPVIIAIRFNTSAYRH